MVKKAREIRIAVSIFRKYYFFRENYERIGLPLEETCGD